MSALTPKLTSALHARRRRRGSAPRPQQKSNRGAIAASYSRYSGDLQRETSIVDQQRECRTMAEANAHQLFARYEFADEAVSGRKRDRAGLNAMLAAAEAGEFDVLYLHSLSRLGRESIITMSILKKLTNEYGIRVICIVEGIDTRRDHCEVVATITSLLHEWYNKEHSANSDRGKDGVHREGYSVGDMPYGYSSEPVPGTETTRPGRGPAPRMRYVIDPESAVWVARIFIWFAVERRSLARICQELNERRIPKGSRAQVERWYRDGVVRILKNPKYVGIWHFKVTKTLRDPETGETRCVRRSVEESAPWTRHFPDLRMISDELFAAAQKRLQENAARYGRARDDVDPPRLGQRLSGLVKCAACGRDFHCGGADSADMYCPGRGDGTCACRTRLRRVHAERMILDEIGERLLRSSEWQEAIYREVLRCWRERAPRTATELEAAEHELAELQAKADRLLDHVEQGSADAEVYNRLNLRSAQLNALENKIGILRREHENVGPEPTKEWVHERVAALGEALNGDLPAAAPALRAVLATPIGVAEVHGTVRNRLSLEGRFRLSATTVAHAVCGTKPDRQAVGENGLAEEIVIDFSRPDPLVDEVDRAKALYDRGLTQRDIQRELGCGKSKVHRLLHHWSEWNNQPLPDGRRRRWTLSQPESKLALYKRISADVKRLWDEGLLIGAIAEELGCGRHLVEKALTHWYSSRKQKKPDGRTRRKSLARKTSKPGRS